MEDHGMCWKGSPLAAGGTSHFPDLSWAGFPKPQPCIVTDGCLAQVWLKGSRLHHRIPTPPSSWPCSGVSLRALSGACSSLPHPEKVVGKLYVYVF